MDILNRESLLKKDDLKVEQVNLGNNQCVYVRQMTGRERDMFDRTLIKEVRDNKGNVDYERTLEDFRAKLAVHTVCDADGNNVLKPEDYNILSENISAAKLEKVVNVAQRLNRLTDEDKENLLKNSEGALSADSD